METPLSDHVKEIILGSVLGDGSLKIHKPYKNARFSFRHSVKQKEYFLWKAHALRKIASEHYIWTQGKDGKDGYGGEKLRFQSRALEALTELYRLIHKKGEKGKMRVRRTWLNQLTPLSLAIWWLDDGSLVGDTRQGVLCTDGFSLEEVKILDRYMKKVWNIGTGISRVKDKEQYRLRIHSTENLQKFLRIILPHIPVAEMLPKVLLLYKDSQLQQRWISEVLHLSHFSEDVIRQQVAMKKAQWKHFR